MQKLTKRHNYFFTMETDPKLPGHLDKRKYYTGLTIHKQCWGLKFNSIRRKIECRITQLLHKCLQPNYQTPWSHRCPQGFLSRSQATWRLLPKEAIHRPRPEQESLRLYRGAENKNLVAVARPAYCAFPEKGFALKQCKRYKYNQFLGTSNQGLHMALKTGTLPFISGVLSHRATQWSRELLFSIRCHTNLQRWMIALCHLRPRDTHNSLWGRKQEISSSANKATSE